MLESEQHSVDIRQADRPGDLGWVVMAHGEQYAAEFGWNSELKHSSLASSPTSVLIMTRRASERGSRKSMDIELVACFAYARTTFGSAADSAGHDRWPRPTTRPPLDSTSVSTSRRRPDTAEWCSGPMTRWRLHAIFTLLPVSPSSTSRHTIASVWTSSVENYELDLVANGDHS